MYIYIIPSELSKLYLKKKEKNGVPQESSQCILHGSHVD